MNCKQGDLAFFVGPDGRVIKHGCVVRCMEFAGHGIGGSQGEADDYWHIEYNGMTTGLRGLPLGCRDAHLRPIRDSDGQDETLTWAGKPQRVTA